VKDSLDIFRQIFYILFHHLTTQDIQPPGPLSDQALLVNISQPTIQHQNIPELCRMVMDT
jgi:hypothetical protein